MKLEFLDDINAGGKFRQVISNELVRLYDFDAIQAKIFRQNIADKILKDNGTFNLSSLNFVELVNCNLIFTISNKDEGVKTKDKVNFECALTIPLYREMIQLIEPFEQGEVGGYQWLYDLDCPIDLLFSPAGTW